VCVCVCVCVCGVGGKGKGWFHGIEKMGKNKIKCSNIRNSTQKDRSQWEEERKETRLKGRKEE